MSKNEKDFFEFGNPCRDDGYSIQLMQQKGLGYRRILGGGGGGGEKCFGFFLIV
jgi:hypothetical protein